MKFEEIQEVIEKFVQENKRKEYGDQKKYKMKTSDALFCAEDRSRNRIFRNAIDQAIQENKKSTHYHVVDAGSGLGILGLFALAQGANVCTFIEHNTDTYTLSKRLIKKLGYEKQVSYINQDATSLILQTKFDLLISETLSSDLESEDFCAIINHLQQFAKKKYCIIPQHIEQEIIQLNKKGEIIKEETQSFDTKQARPQTITIDKQTHKIVYKGTLTLYDHHSISSGDCISLFNTREKIIDRNT